MGVTYSVGEVNHLYTFFVKWSPEIYTKGYKKRFRSRRVGKNQQDRHRQAADKVFAVISKLFSDPVNKLKTAKIWKIITVKSSKRSLSLCRSVESELDGEYLECEDVVPVLKHESQLLNGYHLQKLASHLPPKTQGYPWKLVYSTAIHGTSLRTLYRNMANLDSPVLLVIKDMTKKVFGAFCSDPLRVSKYFYGTGETFLFSFSPDFQQYRWSGENSYFVCGNWESLQIGGGGGSFALWLDADLYHGASFPCPTFHNDPLSTHEDFTVLDVEVWTVQS